MITYKGFFIELVYSEDDGGWYADVINKNGDTIDKGLVWDKKHHAKSDAMEAIDKLQNEPKE